jgi:chemotaxis protein MotB
MSAGGPHDRRRHPAGGHEEHADERWLLTYADMITLLMALFIVMWSMSAVNISKFAALKTSLKAAFSPGHVLEQDKNVLKGQPSVLDGAGPAIQPTPPQPEAQQQTTQAQMQIQPITNPIEHAAAMQELENLRRLRAQIESYARHNGFAGQLRTSIDERGLVVRLLTDEVLFNTGEAVLQQRSFPLLDRIARLIAKEIPNDVRVEGNTDSVPISTAEFRSNWELSTTRATAVLEELLAEGVAPARLSAAGYADQRPIASNATAAGRSLNRRVDLVVLRRYAADQKGTTK